MQQPPSSTNEPPSIRFLKWANNNLPWLYPLWWLLENTVVSAALHIDNSKYFAGIAIIMMNVVSKFYPITFSKSAEEFLKSTTHKYIILAFMLWMGTRDLFIALILTCIIILLSDYLLNEECKWCIIPERMRKLHTLMSASAAAGFEITDDELAAAEATIKKAKREREIKQQKDLFTKFTWQKS